ncbi:hypothetical protein [Catellatospora sp. NPDC049609]|uniref:hypothetical protein n=1 Tax=Catellatospora sp. NPDC049609 TaxID=3155505 RepID=UPI00343431D6
MALMRKQRLFGWVTSTAQHPAGRRWRVTVVLGRRRVVHNWVDSWGKVREQLAEADALRPPTWPADWPR